MARPSKGERTRVPFNCPNDLLDRLDAWQKAGGASDRGAALQIAVERLLDPPATAPAMPLAHTPANLPRQAGLTERQLRPEPTLPPEIPGVVVKRPTFTKLDTSMVQYAGDVDRKPYQRTPKAKPLGR